MEKRIISFLNKKLFLCPFCEELILDESVLCAPCRAQLLREFDPHPQIQSMKDKFFIYPLFSWNAKSKIILRELIYRLKGGENQRLQAWLAQLFYIKYELYISQRQKVFIPAPAKQKNKKSCFI